MQARRKHASYRHSIIRVRLQVTRREIRDLPTPAVDSELVNVRVPLTPRKTSSLIRRRHDKEIGHHWRGNVCILGRNRDIDLSQWDTYGTLSTMSEVLLQFWQCILKIIDSSSASYISNDIIIIKKCIKQKRGKMGKIAYVSSIYFVLVHFLHSLWLYFFLIFF